MPSTYDALNILICSFEQQQWGMDSSVFLDPTPYFLNDVNLLSVLNGSLMG